MPYDFTYMMYLKHKIKEQTEQTSIGSNNRWLPMRMGLVLWVKKRKRLSYKNWHGNMKYGIGNIANNISNCGVRQAYPGGHFVSYRNVSSLLYT